MNGNLIVNDEYVTSKVNSLNKLFSQLHDISCCYISIADYELTEDNISLFNIPLLLEGYESEASIIDVSNIFDKTQKTRASSFTTDAVAIAFYENSNTDIISVYYDLKNNTRYKMMNGYVFSDISAATAEPYADGEKLLEMLMEKNVFSWSDIDESDRIVDGGSMVLAVKYSDDSVFMVSASGVLSQILPKDYASIRSSLLN